MSIKQINQKALYITKNFINSSTYWYNYAVKVNSEGNLFKQGTNELIQPHDHHKRFLAAILAGEDLFGCYGMTLPSHRPTPEQIDQEVMKTVARFLTFGSLRSFADVVKGKF